VVAVHGTRHSHAGLASSRELEEGHLGGGVLHGNAVRVEFGKISAALVGSVFCAIDQVAVENLLGESERAAKLLAGNSDACRNASVCGLDHVEIKKHSYLMNFSSEKIEILKTAKRENLSVFGDMLTRLLCNFSKVVKAGLQM
jgi:hypothetical protein